MEKSQNGTEQPGIVPNLAESFGVEFLTNGENIKDAMREMGNFSFRRSGLAEDGSVYFEGERGDGTEIEITIKKGEHYKSPAEIEKEQQA